ncbi:MAG: fumarylacetoacetate hydrolase family protein [Candidatus Sulfotelmatobacter sp.]|jgi:2-keto-4-pentenoate hydratase/2-oxohepta-3-ene-1,7-dioic acid hydratase in catechol pathway
MRLIRFGRQGREKPGVLLDGKRKDLSAYFQDWNSTFFAESGLERLSTLLKTDEARRLPEVSELDRWGAPVARPGKIVCVGLNFSDHAKESGMPVPTEPVLFLKATNTVVGPFDDILIPRNSNKTDWEVELGLIIAREARYLNSVGYATACIAGYCISHDVSEREFQLERGGQWSKGKSCDTFNPLGPWLTTSDELADVSKLRMTLMVNGQLMQNGSTETMIFSPAQLVHYISQFMTLEPGDLISTGTPPGVGLGLKPPCYLRRGDIVELEIQHLGKQRQSCRQV